MNFRWDFRTASCKPDVIFYSMLKTSFLLGVASATLLLASCSEDRLSSGQCEVPEKAVSSKLIFTSENAVAGKLLVYFDAEAAGTVESSSSAATKAGGPCTRSGISTFDTAVEHIGIVSIERLFPVDPRHEERTRAAGLHRWYIVRFDENTDLDKAAVSMAGVPEVTAVEFSQKMELSDRWKATPLSVESSAAVSQTGDAIFNDPHLPLQWHYINTGNTALYSGIRAGADVNCADAWRLTTGDPRVVVAVVDDCVQWDHPDLAANMWTNGEEIAGNGIDDDGNGFADDVHGYNFVNDTALTLSEGDGASHGTHVAGTVAAVNNNGTGVCGVAGGSGNGDGIRIMSCQIFHNEDGGSSDQSAKAIKYAADNGACILQCSFGYGGGAFTSDEQYTQAASAEKQAIDYFIDTKNCDAVDGGIVIFAAGNELTAMSAYPGACRDYISVTAMSCDYTPAYYTNYGPGCNIAAPGGDAYQSLLETNFQSSSSQVMSTIIGGYGYMQGTSMACPHVSGVAALGLAYTLELGKTFTRDEFNSILLTSVNAINQYCTGTKQYVTEAGALSSIDMSRYRGLMGTGYIDAYQVLMNIRGTTCIPVSVESQAQIRIADYIGSGDAQISVSSVEISDEDMERLGIKSAPRVFGGNVLLTCTRTGSGIMKVTMRAGTGSESGMSGLPVEKEFALIARPSHSANDGWL